MNKIIKKNQKGFSILSVILVIVAVIVAIGVWTLSGQTNANNTGASSTDMHASAIINDSNAIKARFDELRVNGVDAAYITFIPGGPSTANMLDPTTGIPIPKVSTNALRASPGSTEGYWIYNLMGFKGYYIGYNTIPDETILVAGIKNSVCQRINYALHGSTNVPVVFGANNATLTAGATTSIPISNASIDLVSAANLSGWTAGCFANGGGSDPDETIFFRVLKPN